jgi:hypothetical protein
MELKIILDQIKNQSLPPPISRLQYVEPDGKPFDSEAALQVWQAIGQKHAGGKFQVDDANRFLYLNLIYWAHGNDTMKCHHPDGKTVVSGNLNAGIYIAGDTGTGKTLATKILLDYILLRRFNIKFGEMKYPLTWTSVRADEICDAYQQTGDLTNCKKCSILCVQDIGSEPLETLNMGNRVNVMRQILEHRGDYGDRLTLITSNLPYTHKLFIDRYGDRVASRLNEMVNYYELKGQDRRKRV